MDEKAEEQQNYSEQANRIAKRARLALVNRQIAELDNAKDTISMDFQSADAQLMLAEASFNRNPC